MKYAFVENGVVTVISTTQPMKRVNGNRAKDTDARWIECADEVFAGFTHIDGEFFAPEPDAQTPDEASVKKALVETLADEGKTTEAIKTLMELIP